MAKLTNLYLRPDEIQFLVVAVLSLLEDMQQLNGKYEPTPKGKKYIDEMIASGKKLKIKLSAIGVDMSDLPPYNEGDENEFFTSIKN